MASIPLGLDLDEDLPPISPSVSQEVRNAIVEERQRMHNRSLYKINLNLQQVQAYLLKLDGQLSVWRWFAPLVASIAASIVTAYIIRSLP